MPRNRRTNEQIAFALRQAENGTPVAEICRKMGVSEPSFYRWKKQFSATGGAARSSPKGYRRWGAGSSMRTELVGCGGLLLSLARPNGGPFVNDDRSGNASAAHTPFCVTLLSCACRSMEQR